MGSDRSDPVLHADGSSHSRHESRKNRETDGRRYKKEYKVPAIKVANLDCSDILCTSGKGSYNETLSNGQYEGSEPEQDGDGYVWAESKGQGTFGDVW